MSATDSGQMLGQMLGQMNGSNAVTEVIAADDELGAILSDSVTRLLADHVDREVLEAARRGTWPAALWSALVEAGLTKCLVGEHAGGVGASWQSTATIAHALGYFNAPVPLMETIVAGWLLDRAALAVPEAVMTFASGSELAVTDVEEGRALSGELIAVPWARDARYLIVAMGDCEASAPEIALIELSSDGSATSTGVEIVARRNLAGEPRDEVHLEMVVPSAIGQLDGGDFSFADLGTTAVLGALVRSAQIAGGVERVLEHSLTYASDRVQFGRPLGKFQAIQHYLATLATRAAQATLACKAAFRSLDRVADPFDIACAKVTVGEAAQLAGQIGHQIHGAIGFAEEHELHYSTQRLWCWQAEYGNEATWARWLGSQALARDADALWSDLTDRQRSR